MNKTETLFRSFILGAAIAVGVASASAATVVVLPGDPTWGSLPGENNAGSSATITGTAPRSGNGSLELIGDRTRFSMGNYYSAASNLGLLDQVLQLTYQWQVAVGSTNPYNADYTPALRLHIWDQGVRSELIWEGAYNNVYGNMSKGTWYESNANDQFYRFVTGAGVTLQGGAQVNQSISTWANGVRPDETSWYSNNAFVSAISVGDGSGASSAYHAFVDNVTFGIKGVTNTYNFEASAAQVPEPGSIALVGLALMGLVTIRKRAQKRA